MNVIHCILDYYFPDLSGIDGMAIRQKILVEERRRFIGTKGDGTEDTTKLQLANAMLQYMGAGVADDMNYISDGYSPSQRKVTRKFTLPFLLMPPPYGKL